MFLGVLFVIFSTQEWHCSNSFLCPLSTFLFTFSVLSFSGLYLFFTANIVIELKSFFGSLSLHPKEVDKIMFRWLHVIAWIAVFIISTIFTTIGLPDSVPKNGTNGTNFTSSLPIANIHPIPILKVRLYLIFNRINFFILKFKFYFTILVLLLFDKMAYFCIIYLTCVIHARVDFGRLFWS